MSVFVHRFSVRKKFQRTFSLPYILSSCFFCTFPVPVFPWDGSCALTDLSFVMATFVASRLYFSCSLFCSKCKIKIVNGRVTTFTLTLSCPSLNPCSQPDPNPHPHPHPPQNELAILEFIHVLVQTSDHLQIPHAHARTHTYSYACTRTRTHAQPTYPHTNSRARTWIF